MVREDDRLFIRTIKGTFGELVMSTATQVVVVNCGRRLAVGSPTQIMANPEVVAAYLGANERG